MKQPHEEQALNISEEVHDSIVHGLELQNSILISKIRRLERRLDNATDIIHSLEALNKVNVEHQKELKFVVVYGLDIIRGIKKELKRDPNFRRQKQTVLKMLNSYKQQYSNHIGNPEVDTLTDEDKI